MVCVVIGNGINKLNTMPADGYVDLAITIPAYSVIVPLTSGDVYIINRHNVICSANILYIYITLLVHVKSCNNIIINNI